MAKIETVKIKHIGFPFIRINKCNFDSEKHELFEKLVVEEPEPEPEPEPESSDEIELKAISELGEMKAGQVKEYALLFGEKGVNGLTKEKLIAKLVREKHVK